MSEPGEVAALRQQATEALLRGEPQAALQPLARAVELAPDDAECLGLLAVSLSESGLHAEALTAFSRAVSLRPHSAGLHFNRGRALERALQPVEAARSYREALRLQPDHAGARSRLAILGESTGPGSDDGKAPGVPPPPSPPVTTPSSTASPHALLTAPAGRAQVECSRCRQTVPHELFCAACRAPLPPMAADGALAWAVLREAAAWADQETLDDYCFYPVREAFFRRLFAWGIDRGLIAAPAYLGLGLDRIPALGVPAWPCFAVAVLVAAVELWMLSLHGSSVGKRVFGLKVVDADGHPPGWSTAAGRQVEQLVSLAVFGLGCLWMLWDDEQRTWHDRWSGTVVVRA